LGRWFCKDKVLKGRFMKVRTTILFCLVLGIVTVFVYEYGWAKSEEKVPSSGVTIGVVSVRRVFQECKRNAKYRADVEVEREKLVDELDKLSKEIEAEKAGLKTLKVGSSDHLKLMESVYEKQGSLQARQEFYKQQIELKDQKWTEEIYQDVLRATGEVAEAKGLDLVFESDEPDLDAVSAQELMMAIRTHKVLYSGGCLDITDEVTERVDEEK